jgi:hypothetical protein
MDEKHPISIRETAGGLHLQYFTSTSVIAKDTIQRIHSENEGLFEDEKKTVATLKPNHFNFTFRNATARAAISWAVFCGRRVIIVEGALAILSELDC